MDQKALFDGLLTYVCLVVIITFHEFGHAWTAMKCGDDTAYRQGRVTLNPASHMDPLGTIFLPLLALSLTMFGSALSGLIIGWGRPVPVDLSNLKNRKRDDILITLAGPAMNVALTILVLVVARVAGLFQSEQVLEFSLRMATLSMFLFFFNLLPVPPLDGSRVMRVVVGMKEETFLRLSQFGFVILIILINIQPVMYFLGAATFGSINLMAAVIGL